jgi:hypothetical protein
MANKKNGPGDGFRSWLTGQDNMGPMGVKWAKIIGTGLTGIGTAMGFQSRADKKKEFMKKYYPHKAYDKKKVVNKTTGLTMGDKFKQFRKGTDEMKVGGPIDWTRNSRKHGG